MDRLRPPFLTAPAPAISSYNASYKNSAHKVTLAENQHIEENKLVYNELQLSTRMQESPKSFGIKMLVSFAQPSCKTHYT